MTVRHLRIFIAVYQTGSITHAAEKLCMTQPAVTRSIKELEQYYGISLFERLNHRLSVTEAGKLFYSFALHIADSFDRMENEIKNWDETGIIRVGASMTLGSILLPQAVKEFQKRYPGIRVRFCVRNGSHLQQALEDNRLDLALIEGNINSGNLVTKEFGEDRLILVFPPDSPLLTLKHIKMHDLAGYPLLLRENGGVTRDLINSVLAAHDMLAEPAMESVSNSAIINAVHEGLGISFLPERLVNDRLASGYITTRDVEDEDFRRKNYIVWHRNKYMTPAMTEFMEIAISVASQTGKIQARQPE